MNFGFAGQLELSGVSFVSVVGKLESERIAVLAFWTLMEVIDKIITGFDLVEITPNI